MHPFYSTYRRYFPRLSCYHTANANEILDRGGSVNINAANVTAKSTSAPACASTHTHSRLLKPRSVRF